MAHEWLDDAIFYEIYPQSFCDSNSDGIGDLRGIIKKLDYILDLGCNAIWINPAFDSPFVDAGYDVRDYYRVAPRYGTNEDMRLVFREAHRRGMHVLLDLVPGHTSSECKWFKESSKAEKNKYTDRYIWTDNIWTEPEQKVTNITGYIRGGSERNGAAAVNFFTAQPALNYGFARTDEPWQQSVDAQGPMETREELKNIMRFWLDMGCDGFRVDMAMSLVKNDDDQSATIKLWQDFREFLDREYPEAVMVSEWGQPDKSLAGGFHMDFLLHFGPSNYLDLFRVDHPYFSREGKGDAHAFFEKYMRNKHLSDKGDGLICIPSGNHDMVRLAHKLDMEEMKIAFAFLLSMPGVPFIYYGDEIGMKYLDGIKSVEGGYERTGSRSPMQWNHSTNAGFSTAPAEDLYIMLDPSEDRPTVEDEMKDEDSLLSTVMELTRVRAEHPALHNRSAFKLLHCEKHSYPLVYERSSEEEGSILVFLNPSDKTVELDFSLPEKCKTIYRHGGSLRRGEGIIEVPGASVNFIKI
ncbi:alpha-amylase family glycosyl hydrolase [Lachnospiraceae bacterium C1.1]|nr:alpha-amylase family glycosyl hydrolase [Lachnospiraceae bacterium C1.1]